MTILLFLSIVIVALLSAGIYYQMMKNRELMGYLEKLKAHDNKGTPSPVAGISQKVWDRLCEELIDSSDDMVLFFDAHKNLRLWNKTAGAVYQFEDGITIDQLNEALSIESSKKFDLALQDILADRRQSVEGLSLSWKSGKTMNHRMYGVPGNHGQLDAIALVGRPEDSDEINKEEPAVDTRIMLGIQEPVKELAQWNSKLVSAVAQQSLKKENLIHIGENQGLLIATANQLLSFYKQELQRSEPFKPFQETVVSCSSNALVKALATILSSHSRLQDFIFQKHIEGQDHYMLVPVVNIQAITVDLFRAIRENIRNDKSQVKVDISWAIKPMEILLNFELSLSILGQDISIERLSDFMKPNEIYTDFQELYLQTGCQLMPFKLAQSKLAIELQCPRDLA